MIYKIIKDIQKLFFISNHFSFCLQSSSVDFSALVNLSTKNRRMLKKFCPLFIISMKTSTDTENAITLLDRVSFLLQKTIFLQSRLLAIHFLKQ